MRGDSRQIGLPLLQWFFSDGSLQCFHSTAQPIDELRKFLFIRKLYLYLVLVPNPLHLDVGIQCKTKLSLGPLERLGHRLSPRLLPRLIVARKQWGKVFCLSDAQSFL